MTTVVGDSYIQGSYKTRAQLRGQPLTPREQQTWAMVAQGLTNKEIAKCMNLQEGTVKHHLRICMAKLDCTSRTQLALKYATMFSGKH